VLGPAVLRTGCAHAGASTCRAHCRADLLRHPGAGNRALLDDCLRRRTPCLAGVTRSFAHVGSGFGVEYPRGSSDRSIIRRQAARPTGTAAHRRTSSGSALRIRASEVVRIELVRLGTGERQAEPKRA
jgi:hypothetical protein